MKSPKGDLSIGFLYDDTLDSSDGVAQYVKTLGSWLSGQGHKVVYLVGGTTIKEWAGAPVYSLSRNLKVPFNANRVSTPLQAGKKSINQVLERRELDVLHVQMPYSPIMAGRVIKRAKSQTAILGTFHIYPAGILARVGTRFLRILCFGTLRRFDMVLSVSDAASGFASKYLGVSSKILPNVVELERFSTAKSKPAPYHIVFLGRLVKRKGCEELLRAFKILRETMPEAKLSIAGDGPQRKKLESFVNDNHLGSSVSFQGFINEQDKPKLLASAAIACFPSLGGESFGIVLIEAMAAGAGVTIGGNNPGYASVLGRRPETLFDPKDAKQFALILKKFLTDEQLAADIHSWQGELVRKYDIETVGPHLVKVYRGAIAKAGRSRHN